MPASPPHNDSAQPSEPLWELGLYVEHRPATTGGPGAHYGRQHYPGLGRQTV